MQKNDDKVGNKNKKSKGKKRAREKDGNRLAKKAQILAFAHVWKTNKLFNYIRLVKKYAFCVCKIHFYPLLC